MNTQDYSKRTPRERAYKAIDTEREYQEVKYPERITTLAYEANLVVNITDKLEKLQAGGEWGKAEHAACLDTMREIAAVCVRAMEKHGAPPRE